MQVVQLCCWGIKIHRSHTSSKVKQTFLQMSNFNMILIQKHFAVFNEALQYETGNYVSGDINVFRERRVRECLAFQFVGFNFLIFRHFPKQSLGHLLFTNPGFLKCLSNLYLSATKLKLGFGEWWDNCFDLFLTSSSFTYSLTGSIPNSSVCFQSRSQASSVGSQTQ